MRVWKSLINTILWLLPKRLARNLVPLQSVYVQLCTVLACTCLFRQVFLCSSEEVLGRLQHFSPLSRGLVEFRFNWCVWISAVMDSFEFTKSGEMGVGVG
jgi:hypothetical protein